MRLPRNFHRLPVAILMLAVASCATVSPPPAEAVATIPAPSMAAIDALGERFNAARAGLVAAYDSGRIVDGPDGVVIAQTVVATSQALVAAQAAIAAGHTHTARLWIAAAGGGVARMEAYLEELPVPASWRVA